MAILLGCGRKDVPQTISGKVPIQHILTPWPLSRSFFSLVSACRVRHGAMGWTVTSAIVTLIAVMAVGYPAQGSPVTLSDAETAIASTHGARLSIGRRAWTKRRRSMQTIPPTDLHCHLPRRGGMNCHRGLVYKGPR